MKHKWNTTTSIAFCEACLLYWAEHNPSREHIPCDKNGTAQRAQQRKEPELFKQLLGVLEAC